MAKEKGIRYVTKRKSMVTEETALNEVLGESGSSLGNDLESSSPSSFTAPPSTSWASHQRPRGRGPDLFIEKIGLQGAYLTRATGYAARLFLRDKFHHVQMGSPGEHAVPRPGRSSTWRTEGNIRFTKSSPPIQCR